MQQHGFELLCERELGEVSGIARLWRHRVTGAQLLSVCNADENKCFGVTFRTPPEDSTGVAHILEHSVLCGSEKYPVREPFVELLKGSLQTFLNAFTFPDKTCYPVAGTNLADFYHLVDVYLDAVFHPRISEQVFFQEGHHVEADAPDAPWSFKGVVYNEMKGVYSTPDSVLAEESQHAVFPDTLYSLDSGGNPEVIPQLTYEAFTAFHEHYYHPSNARFFFWGDDPEERRLEILEAELAAYTRRDVSSEIPLQAHRDMPRLVEVPYAAASGEARAQFTVNWLLCESAETEEVLKLEMLAHILEGLPGSPLRKALIASGLGEDMTGVGLETDLRQAYYSVGLKGVAPDDVAAAEMLIYETLAELAEEGIAPEAVEAAVNSVEFTLRENNSGRFPRGLSAMLQSLSTWLYDGDPLAPLAWEAPLAAIKQAVAAGQPVFEDLLRRRFLENTHRATVVLLPDATLAAVRERREQERLDALQAACTPEQREDLVQETRRLRKAQETPDSPEALATIPSLTLADLPERNAVLTVEQRMQGDRPFFFHETDSSGIVYSNLLLPLAGVPEALLPLVPLLGRGLTECGTQRHDFVELGMRIAAKTGGVAASPLQATVFGDRRALSWLAVQGKAVADRQEALFDIFQEILLEPALDQQERYHHMLLESKARLEYELLASGHATVASRLGARYTEAGLLGEVLGGLSYLEAVRTLLARVEQDWPSVLADLRTLHGLVVRADEAVLGCTADAAAGKQAEALGGRLLQSLPRRTVAAVPRQVPVFPAAEALIAPSQINFVGKAANLYDLGYRYHGSVQVILRHLRMGYLWERVRVQGGAYGAFCSLDRMGGTFVQTSYRDPAVLETLATYDAAADYLRAFQPDQRELTRAIVGAIGELDSYLLPDARGMAALLRHLCGDSPERRQQMREEILGTTVKDFHAFAEVLAQAARHSAICVLGGSAVEAAARQEGWTVRTLL